PFPVSGLSSAYIETKNANGDVTGYYNFSDDGRINSTDGIIFLGREHLGLTGDLYLYFNDGTKIIYNLSDGNRATTANVQTLGPDSSSMKSVRSVPDDTKSIAFQNGDVIVRVHCLTAGTVQVTFPTGLSAYPIAVHAVDSSYLEQNPLDDGMSFNP